MERIYSAREINEYMGYNKSQQNDNKKQFMTRCKNAGLILEDIPTKQGLPNKYKIIEDNFKIEGEEWRPCYCYNEWEVSNKGRVRRISTKKLLGGTSSDVHGYINITGKPEVGGKKRYSVHRLIYFSFHPEEIEKENILVIDHINGCRGDNRIENLRAISSRKNVEFREENNKQIQELLGKLIIQYGYEKVYDYLLTFESETKGIL
jgi:hypothetical protein